MVLGGSWWFLGFLPKNRGFADLGHSPFYLARELTIFFERLTIQVLGGLRESCVVFPPTKAKTKNEC